MDAKSAAIEWHQLYPGGVEPAMDDIADYIGAAKPLWSSLIRYFEEAYKAKPKLTYSGCGMKPGWNVKFQKSGQAFGTLYPLEDAFDVMLVVSYRLDPLMQQVLPELSEKTANLYRAAGDYMKLGKWIMLRIDSPQALEDYKRMIAVKLAPAKIYP